MSIWVVMIAAFSFVVIVTALVQRYPRSWWAAELLRWYGVRPTGPEGTYRRLDHFRSAGLSVLVAVLLMALSIVALVISERFPNRSTGNAIALTYFFGLYLLAAVAVLSGVISLWRGVFWRRRQANARDTEHSQEGNPRDA